MRIISASIKNYRAIGDLSLSFLDNLGKPRDLTVLSGPNGTGKTSVLHAITQALRGAIGYRTPDVPNPCQDDIHKTGSKVGGWIADHQDISVDVQVQFEDDEQDAIHEILELLKQPAPPDIPSGRLVVSWRFPPGFSQDGTREPWWWTSIDPPLPNVRLWLTARRLAIRAWVQREQGMTHSLLRRIGGFLFFPQDRNLQKRVIGDDVPSFSANGDTGGSSDSDDADYDDQKPREKSISEILHYLSDYAKNRVPPLPDEQNWEKRIQHFFKKVCAPRQYVGYLYRGEDDYYGSPVLRDRNDFYPLSHAASGEQVVLEYITRLTFPSPFGQKCDSD
jgi:energy-coupling factor transporter ATP-binding protein EcfA2